MATIEKLPRQAGIVYKCTVRKVGHPKISRTFKTRSAAERWGRKYESDLERDDAGLTSEANRRSLSEAIAAFREEKLPDLSPTTARPYSLHLEFWDKQLGHLRLAEVSAAKIDAERDALRAAGRSPATVNRYLATLASVLTLAVKGKHWLKTSPMREVAKLTERNAGTRFLSDEELARLLTACRESASPDLLLAVLLAISTGARQAEIMGLRWADIDLDNQVLRVRVNNATANKGQPRALPIAAAALPLLQERFRQEQARHREEKVTPLRDPGLVFPSRVSRNQPVQLRQPWETALLRAKIANFRWHDLRHSAASFLAKRGASLLEIGAILGHKSANTTKRYAHLTEKHAHALVHAMADDLLLEAAPTQEGGNHG